MPSFQVVLAIGTTAFGVILALLYIDRPASSIADNLAVLILIGLVWALAVGMWIDLMRGR